MRNSPRSIFARRMGSITSPARGFGILKSRTRGNGGVSPTGFFSSPSTACSRLWRSKARIQRGLGGRQSISMSRCFERPFGRLRVSTGRQTFVKSCAGMIRMWYFPALIALCAIPSSSSLVSSACIFGCLQSGSRRAQAPLCWIFPNFDKRGGVGPSTSRLSLPSCPEASHHGW